MDRERFRSRSPFRSIADMKSDSRDRLARMQRESQERLEQLQRDNQARKDRFEAESNARREKLQEQDEEVRRRIIQNMEEVGVFPWIYVDEQLPQEEAEGIMIDEESQTIEILRQGYSTGNIDLVTLGQRRYMLSFTRDLMASTMDRGNQYKATRAEETRTRSAALTDWMDVNAFASFHGREVASPILPPRTTTPAAEY